MFKVGDKLLWFYVSGRTSFALYEGLWDKLHTNSSSIKVYDIKDEQIYGANPKNIVLASKIDILLYF